MECDHATDAEVRLYDRLFTDESPDGHKHRDFMEFLNPASLEVLKGCKVEPVLAKAEATKPWQFTRLGYFTLDSKLAGDGHLIFNRAVTLKDGWKGKG